VKAASIAYLLPMAKRVVDLTAEELDKLAAEAWSTAARDALAGGLSVTGSRDGRRYRYHPDGRIEDLGPVAPLPAEDALEISPSRGHLKTLDDLFHETLKDIYYAEKKILSALPKMAKAAQSDELRAVFEKHHRETEGHVSRLEKVFALIEEPARGKRCDAIEGLIEEGEEIIREFKGSPILDAGLLASAQAVEHYEISRYGTVKAWAEKLGMQQAVRLLDQTLTEQKSADEALTGLAVAAINHNQVSKSRKSFA
jgi:ferritin-like metal-binding protein YciE